MTITALLSAYADGSLTPQQVLAHIDEADTSYTHKNIWIHKLTADERAPYLERLKGESPDTLPLYGIPFAIKDNIDLAGIPTTAACVEYRYTPERSAFVVEKLIEAGAIPVGKTNLDQFATGLVGTRSPEPWGPCHNAFNDEYISGGSSSGSAVSVALGLAAFSLGTDTAGSGRVPASFNNLIGVKPTRGLLSTRGVVPACRSLDCVTIFANTTDDANRVLTEAAIYDAEDDYACPNVYDNLGRHYGLPEGEFHFAVPKPDQLEFFGNESAQSLFEDAVKQLETLGGIKREMDFSAFLSAAKLLYEGPWTAERYVAIEELITTQADKLLPVINTIIGGSVDKTAMDAFKAIYQLQHYKKITDELMDDVDILVTPTAGTIYTIDEVLADPIKLNSNLGYYTNYMNLLDYASIAVPVGFMDNGLPWGITFVSRAFSDIKLLSFARRWQQALQLPMGASQSLPSLDTHDTQLPTQSIPVVVAGAHLEGLPLNWQLTERGAKLQSRTKTVARYKLYALAGGPPYRPGVVRVEQGGASLEVEVWSVPNQEFGSFVANIPAPLGIGKLELADGRWLPGFICEPYGIEDATDITEFGGWRAYMAS
ncbi:MAG: allophanate hydrolase [Gammaproteobacteria bacterium]|nr:allophanate hydrolase [Gammaproteobacteria bacterium]